MRYSTEPRDRPLVKGYGFLSFTKNMGKTLSNKDCQKIYNRCNKNNIKKSNSKSSRKNLSSDW